MTIEFRARVTLEYETEAEVIRQYEDDPEWFKQGVSTVTATFERKAEGVGMSAIYVPSAYVNFVIGDAEKLRVLYGEEGK